MDGLMSTEPASSVKWAFTQSRRRLRCEMSIFRRHLQTNSSKRTESMSSSVMLAVVGALVFSSACHTSTTSQTPAAPVRIALTNTPLPYLPVILADSLGYYRQEGLAVTIVIPPVPRR